MKIRPTPAFAWILENIEVPPLNNPIPHSLSDIIREAVDSLPEPDKSMVEMRFWERLTYDEIAIELGFQSKGACYYYVKKAMERLKEIIQNDGYFTT